MTGFKGITLESPVPLELEWNEFSEITFVLFMVLGRHLVSKDVLNYGPLLLVLKLSFFVSRTVSYLGSSQKECILNLLLISRVKRDNLVIFHAQFSFLVIK